LIPIVIAKFGGSALGVNGTLIGSIMDRIKQLKEKTKVLAVFSAPLVNYQGKVISMTDVAMCVGRSYASSKPVDIEVLREIYDQIASQHISGDLSEKFHSDLDKFFRQVIISLKQAAENRRFVDVIRSRILAYSGEIPMSYLMDYIVRSQGMTSDHVSIEKWPIITDDNFEAANFLVEESKKHSSHFIDLVERNEIVCIGGFIGKTIDGLETTYERGGSDRTAADTAILLNERYNVKVDFEKDCAVLSADPKIVKNGLESIRYLSYNEAKLAGMFGMKILDPAAIKEILDNNLDIPIAITNMKDPSDTTMIEREPIDQNNTGDNLVKIITGKKNCAIVRIESIAASHLIASLEKDKQYHDFVKLSPYWQNDIEISRLLFLDADYVRKEEHHFKAYYPKVEIVYGRGVVTLIGDMMWKVPNIVSTTSSLVGEHGINILNLDAQEETSRILIVVEDKSTNVADAVVAIHSKRTRIQTSKTKNE
jgi:aspartate kinase